MRGKAKALKALLIAPGITPACAGKSFCKGFRYCCTGDHPRVCGEKARREMTEQLTEGSPPRVRGKVGFPGCQHLSGGITPACAGKRMYALASGQRARDHPRVCGEKSPVMIACRTVAGSPPRVRGKACLIRKKQIHPRITPACAGKSQSRHPPQAHPTDHPRVCGEKCHSRLSAASALGSPPRVRGKVQPVQLVHDALGITPACAGKRLKRSHSIGHFSCILCLFHSVLHRASVSGGSRAGPCAPPCLPAQNAVPV